MRHAAKVHGRDRPRHRSGTAQHKRHYLTRGGLPRPESFPHLRIVAEIYDFEAPATLDHQPPAAAGTAQAYRRAIVEQIVLQPEIIAAPWAPQLSLHQRHHQTQRRTRYPSATIPASKTRLPHSLIGRPPQRSRATNTRPTGPCAELRRRAPPQMS